jgi:hypothetical protein
VIPAILAAPAVESVIGSLAGSVVGSVAGLFGGNGPSSSAGATSAASSFAPILRQAAAHATASMYATPSGSMTAADWSGMSGTDLHSWMMSLTGRHVHAVSTQGKTVSGIVQGFSTMNGTTGLNISGHFVSLSNLNQVSWSPAIH